MRPFRRAAEPPSRRAAPAVLAVLAALAVLTPASAAAQATRDQARLVFTVFGAYNGGGDLWQVGIQPVRFPNFDPDEVDSLAVARKLSSGFGLGVSATYYPGPVLGYIGEVALLGVGYDDRCTLVSPPTNNTGEVVCDGIQGSERGASMVLLSAGLVARAMSQGVVSPYVRAGLGLAVGSQSSLRMFGPTDGTQGEIFLVYEDESNTRVTPAFLLGAGITGQVTPGMQFRLEARDNIVGFATITGPTTTDGLVPPSKTEYKHVWTVSLGVDIVLERKRGRRY
jgi:opacity protein-like surface antigen